MNLSIWTCGAICSGKDAAESMKHEPNCFHTRFRSFNECSRENMAAVILWNTSFDQGQSAIFVSFSCGVGGVDKGRRRRRRNC